MYTNLFHPVRAVVPVHEILYGVDTVNIDNEGWLLGLFHRSKDFLNVKSSKTYNDLAHRYQFKEPLSGDETEPLLVVYFGF